MKKTTWLVRFKENGDEYEGSLSVTAYWLEKDKNNPKAFEADGVKIELDEEIISIEEE